MPNASCYCQIRSTASEGGTLNISSPPRPKLVGVVIDHDLIVVVLRGILPLNGSIHQHSSADAAVDVVQVPVKIED